MIDRSYLPYKSAREYADRGMAKWMGFFLSEHSSALGKEFEEDEDLFVHDSLSFYSSEESFFKERKAPENFRRKETGF